MSIIDTAKYFLVVSIFTPKKCGEGILEWY